MIRTPDRDPWLATPLIRPGDLRDYLATTLVAIAIAVAIVQRPGSSRHGEDCHRDARGGG